MSEFEKLVKKNDKALAQGRKDFEKFMTKDLTKKKRK